MHIGRLDALNPTSLIETLLPDPRDLLRLLLHGRRDQQPLLPEHRIRQHGHQRLEDQDARPPDLARALALPDPLVDGEDPGHRLDDELWRVDAVGEGDRHLRAERLGVLLPRDDEVPEPRRVHPGAEGAHRVEERRLVVIGEGVGRRGGFVEGDEGGGLEAVDLGEGGVDGAVDGELAAVEGF